MIIILDKNDLDEKSRFKKIEDIVLREDFRYNWNDRARLILYQNKGEVKVLRADAFTHWEETVTEIELIPKLIYKYMEYHNAFAYNAIVPVIFELCKLLHDNKDLIKLVGKLEKKAFERS
jgi:hypothetical protein